jgi:ribonucleoside-diphosphate reductase alpha chain
MNCTTHKIEGDSLEDISDTAYTIMRASSRGQGIGIDISNLRPLDSPVNNAARTSTGAISFMDMLNHVGSTIGQEGRRAALLFSISDSHPDFYRWGAKDKLCPNCSGAGCDSCSNGYIPLDFLNIKKLPGMSSANISVRISDAFMKSVQEDLMWKMYFNGESGGESFRTVVNTPAQDIFDTLATSAHAAAEPGVLFWDTSKRFSNSDLFGPEWGIAGVNACSEQVLDQDGVCNLGSMNLSSYVMQPFTKHAAFDYDGFTRDCRLAVRFLDSVIDLEVANKGYITDTQYKSLVGLRRVGLGVMGFADMLAMLGLRYSASDLTTIQLVENVFAALRNAAYEESVSMAMEKGPAGVWYHAGAEWDEIVEKGFFGTLPAYLKQGIKMFGTRNITLTSIAPTGTISNLFGVTSGIEPLFAPRFTRRVRMNGEDEFIEYVHPGIKRALEMGLPEEIYETAYQVSPENHIGIQAIAQAHIDQSISKTLNLPKTATPGDVAMAYMNGWKAGLKGMTVYVDESRSEQVLYASKDEGEACPQCGGELIHENGCVDCSVCTYSVCSI